MQSCKLDDRYSRASLLKLISEVKSVRGDEEGFSRLTRCLPEPLGNVAKRVNDHLQNGENRQLTVRVVFPEKIPQLKHLVKAVDGLSLSDKELAGMTSEHQEKLVMQLAEEMEKSGQEYLSRDDIERILEKRRLKARGKKQ